MSQLESSLGASDGQSAVGAATAVVDTPTTQDSQQTSSAAPGSPASPATTGDVQGTSAQPSTTTDPDPLAGVPSLDELNALPDTAQYKKSLIQMRNAIDTQFKPKLEDLTQRFSVFEPVADRFEKPEDLQSILDLRDGLIGWENDPQTGQPIPSAVKGAQLLSTNHPQHADDLVFELLGLPATDPVTGQQRERIDIVLSGMAADPEMRSRALQILGGVEPSATAPQWQPTVEDLGVVATDPTNPTPEEKLLQDIYRKLPYEEWTELKANSPEYIRSALAKEKLVQDLTREREATQQREQQRTQQRETYINQQAQQAADEHVSTQLNEALATFHQSVVQQCNFIKPLDPAQLPQGMSPEQAATMNQQIDRANKSEAVQMTATVIGLLNPQVRAHILPLMKEVGLVDDRTLAEIEKAATAFGSNARNYGQLSYRGKLQANGQYQPDASVTNFSNEAGRALKSLVGYANQIRGALTDTRSSFFELRATQHNDTLNGAAQVRPPLNGQGYNPTTAAAPNARPTGWMTRQEIEQLAQR